MPRRHVTAYPRAAGTTSWTVTRMTKPKNPFPTTPTPELEATL